MSSSSIRRPARAGFFVETGVAGLEGLPFATQPVKLAPVVEPTPVVDARARPSAVGHGRELLLDGVRVVEFGVAAVVPEMCAVLSELGADVIKIESRANLDVLRMGSGRIELMDKNFTFNDECRGRRSVALDLTTERGRELAFALCASADVVAENQRGGVLDRRGLGYDAVRALNPRVVYASSQGYGRGGPLGEMPAYGPLNSGFSGVHMLWNHPDAPYPCGTSMNHPDHIAGTPARGRRARRARRTGGVGRGSTHRAGPDRGVRLPHRREVPAGGA